MKRFGQFIHVKHEYFESYKKYLANFWHEVLEKIKDRNINNYSVFHKDGQLLAYMEYAGDDFEADIAKKIANAKTQEWRAIMKPMQQPDENRKEGEWWVSLEEVFCLD